MLLSIAWDKIKNIQYCLWSIKMIDHPHWIWWLVMPRKINSLVINTVLSESHIFRCIYLYKTHHIERIWIWIMTKVIFKQVLSINIYSPLQYWFIIFHHHYHLVISLYNNISIVLLWEMPIHVCKIKNLFFLSDIEEYMRVIIIVDFIWRIPPTIVADSTQRRHFLYH